MRREHPWRSSLLDPSPPLSYSFPPPFSIVEGASTHHRPPVATPPGETGGPGPPISARFHSHPLGDSYTDYIHHGCDNFRGKANAISTRAEHNRTERALPRFRLPPLGFPGNEP